MTTPCTTSANKHSDDGLVAATKRGDAQAFAELVLRHRQKVIDVAQHITMTAVQILKSPTYSANAQNS